MTLAIDVQTTANNARKVVLVGPLDSVTAPQLEQRMPEFTGANIKVVVFDMEKLDFISSAGLRIIFKTLKVVKAQGGSVGVSKMSPQVRKVFDIVKALPDLNVFASEAEMDDYLEVMQQNVSKE